MDPDFLDDLIVQLETIAPKRGRLATQLSDSIARIEDRLASLDGKMACKINGSTVSLSFSRYRDKWMLRVQELRSGTRVFTLDSEIPLRTASVELKVQGVLLIEALLKEMLSQQRDRLKALEHAATIGTDLAKRLDSSAKEGDQ